MDEFPQWMKVQTDEFGEVEIVVSSAAEAKALKAGEAAVKQIVSAQGYRYEVVYPPK